MTTTSPLRLIATVCTTQVLAEIGVYALPALLPTLMWTWSLSNAEAGWITSIYYVGYALSSPVLISLTDRVEPRWVYCWGMILLTGSHLGFALVADGFWGAMTCRTLAGIGWAGAYMPGLKVLSDRLEGRMQSRGVSWHAAAIGVSGALSFVVAGTVAAWFHWRWAFGVGAMGTCMALFIAVLAMPKQPPRPVTAAATRRLLDFRPVLRNRAAMAYALGYGVHSWEVNALRGWAVTFLTFTALHQGGATPLVGPTVVATTMGLLSTWASVFGNELSIRFGRPRLVLMAMIGSMALASLIGFAAALPYPVAAGLVLLYGLFAWLDSSSLTAGTVGSAVPDARGATLAVHSTLGYAGSAVGPLMVGWILDVAGGQSVFGWGVAFAHVALVMVVGPLALLRFRPQALAGDHGAMVCGTPVASPRARA
jgi:MFS family permease